MNVLNAVLDAIDRLHAPLFAFFAPYREIGVISGYIAACINSFFLVPQLVQLYKTKQTAGLSPNTYRAGTVGCAGWVLHGLTVASIPLLWANFVLGLSALFCVIGISLYRNHRHRLPVPTSAVLPSGAHCACCSHSAGGVTP